MFDFLSIKIQPLQVLPADRMVTAPIIISILVPIFVIKKDILSTFFQFWNIYSTFLQINWQISLNLCIEQYSIGILYEKDCDDIMKTSKAWEILRRFKELCKFRGWKTSESEDWVETHNEYHTFLLTRNIHPSSFKNIAANRKFVVREGLSYRVVEAAYTAWLFSETPPDDIANVIFYNPAFSKRVALYDLSPALEGKNLCIKLNHTNSHVFQEFENFLKRELKVKIKPHPIQSSNPETALLQN